MKIIHLLITTSLLGNLAAPAQTLSIGAAHALPDYTKFVAAADTAKRGFAVAFAPADFNGDGRLDLVVQTVEISSPDLTPWGAKVFLQDADGVFQEKNEYLLPTVGITWDFRTVDLNEDGRLDILMEEADNDLLLLPGNGDGTFREPVYLGLSAAGFFSVEEMSGDKHLDIVAAKRDGGIGVFLGAGNGSFTLKSTLDAEVTASFRRFGKSHVADVNKDGRNDVVVGSHAAGGSLDGILKVFFNNGDGTFQDAVETPRVASRMGALGDFNGDGALDYAGSGGAPEQVQIWLGQPNGNFNRRTTLSVSSAFSAVYDVKAVDINFDGILDLLVSGESSGTVYAAPISIFLGRGDGTFQLRIAFTQANDARTINMGPKLVDLDGDGFLDILSLCWTAERPVIREALMIARSKGAKRQPGAGALIQVQRSAETAAPSLLLEASADFLTWTALATNAGPAKTWLFTDTARSLSRRFYRTRSSGSAGGNETSLRP